MTLELRWKKWLSEAVTMLLPCLTGASRQGCGVGPSHPCLGLKKCTPGQKPVTNMYAIKTNTDGKDL